MKHTIQVSFHATQVRADQHVVDGTLPKEPGCYGAPCADDKGVINALEVA